MTEKTELVFIADEAAVEERLDRYLSAQMEVSRSHIQKLIDEEAVFINNKLAKANHLLRLGDAIVVHEAPPAPLEVVPQSLPLNILYEDSDIIVINKARGMVVHPAAGNPDGTLVNALLYHCRDLSGINGVLRPGIVHRLDKDTSGAIVVAKNDRAHLALAEQIQRKTAGRIYWAIVHGVIKDDSGRIESLIGRDPADRKRMAVVSKNGKPAVTHFQVLERFDNMTLVCCRLETGRTHQIRVHLAQRGFPVVGDPVYAKRKHRFAIQGQALHAKELHLIHPGTGREMKFFAPLPNDMVVILRALGSKALQEEQAKNERGFIDGKVD